MISNQLSTKPFLDFNERGKTLSIIMAFAFWLLAFFVFDQYTIDKDNHDAQAHLLLISCGLFFVGLFLFFWHSGLSLNKKKNVIQKWSGFQMPLTRKRVVFKSTSHSLDLFTSIIIAKEFRNPGSSSSARGPSTYVVYAVRIKGKTTSVFIWESRSYKQARKLAKKIAIFLNLNLEDASLGKAVIRMAGTLVESVSELAQRTGEYVELPPKPSTMKIVIKPNDDGALEIDIPAMTSNRPPLASIVMGIIAYCLMVKGVAEYINFEMGMIMLFLFFVIFAVRMFARMDAKRGSHIAVSRDRLIIVTKGKVLRKKFNFPDRELKELFLITPNEQMDDILRAFPKQERVSIKSSLANLCTGSIIARTDKATAVITSSISPDEFAYIYALIHSKLTR